jgi:hypothetical protein
LAYRYGLLAAALTAPFALPSSAPARAPSLLWTEAKQVSVNCLAQSQTASDAPAFEANLCRRVRALAGRGAPVPIKQIEFGDPQLTAPGTVVLLVHASVERSKKGRTVAFTIRPYRASGGAIGTDREGDGAAAEIYFGTSPRVVALPASAETDGSFDAALRAALAEVLPWQQPADPPARPL